MISVEETLKLWLNISAKMYYPYTERLIALAKYKICSYYFYIYNDSGLFRYGCYESVAESILEMYFLRFFEWIWNTTSFSCLSSMLVSSNVYVCNSTKQLPPFLLICLCYFTPSSCHTRELMCVYLSCEEKPQSTVVVCCCEFIQWKNDGYAILLGFLQYYSKFEE